MKKARDANLRYEYQVGSLGALGNDGGGHWKRYVVCPQKNKP